MTGAMTTDLACVVAMGAWSLLLTLPVLYGRLTTPGAAAWGMSARDQPFDEPAWVKRASRTHANMLENLGPFAAVVLATHLGGQADAFTAQACQVFCAARVAHGLLYLWGATLVRTLAHFVSIGATLSIAWRALT